MEFILFMGVLEAIAEATEIVTIGLNQCEKFSYVIMNSLAQWIFVRLTLTVWQVDGQTSISVSDCKKLLNPLLIFAKKLWIHENVPFELDISRTNWEKISDKLIWHLKFSIWIFQFFSFIKCENRAREKFWEILEMTNQSELKGWFNQSEA